MDKDKERQEASIIGRILSIEALLLLMGIFSLVSGIITGELIQLFWGGMIITGSILLHFIKKKDWKKHWEEQELYKLRMEEYRRLKKEEAERLKNGGGDGGEQ